MRGENISSILCTSTVDKVSKDCPLENFKYQNVIEIPKLGFVDDLLDINKCGVETKNMNAYTTEEIGKRKLQFSADKCVRIHIKAKNGVEEKECEKISIEGWKEETYEEDSNFETEGYSYWGD